ncbi:sigma-70 family RNA polymerase sigma factor [Actinoplanes sp. HUAS TT8]|uniref:sigma-70 family RNA polymerase sigma factor n=1 Tax=Actinoplanes sp. HUAS TT8 TaxID=3447453 RepID=UPI003F5240C8
MTAGLDDEQKQVPMGPKGNSLPAAGPQLPPAAEFDPFFDRLYPQLVKYGAVVWGSVLDAEEAAADAMSYLYLHWDVIESKEAYARTMVTRSIGRLRRNAARLDQTGAVEERAEPDSGDAAGECADRQWIVELLRTLPPTQQAVMAGFFDQVPTADIAAALGKTEAAVRKNLQLARRRLRDEIERQRTCDSLPPLSATVAAPTPGREFQ